MRSVLAELDTRGAIADRRAIELQLRLRGAPQIKTGRYEIPAHASPEAILRQLAEGRVVLEALTVVEGWTFADMRRVVEAHPSVRQTLKGKDTAEFMNAIGHAGRASGRPFLSGHLPLRGRDHRPRAVCAGIPQDVRGAGWRLVAARLRPAAGGRLRGVDAGLHRREGNRARERAPAHCGSLRDAVAHGTCGCRPTRP